MFAVAFRDADAFGEECLLVIAEDLLAGKIDFAAARPS
jgi:hypothetical protein